MTEIKPLIIGNLVRLDGKDIKGIMVRLVNTPGVLAKVLSILAKYRVNILAVNFPEVASGEKGTLFIIASFMKSDYRRIESEIHSLEFVEDVKIKDPQIGNLLVDLYHFPIVDIEGKRLLIFTENDMESLVVHLKKCFKEGGLAFLYHQGLLTGLLLADVYKKWEIQDLRVALYVNFLRAHALGRYRAEILNYIRKRDTIKIRIKAYDMWECTIAKKYGIKEHSCYFERGVIAGIIESYLNKRVKLKEEKCIAVGNSHCLFTASTSDI